MDFSLPDKVLQLQARLSAFMNDQVLPANAEWLRIAHEGGYPLAIVDDR